MAKVRVPYCRAEPDDPSCPQGPNAIGFALDSADCTGASEYKATFTYNRFTCKIVLYGDAAEGRIAVFVTGRTSFRWKII